MDHEEEYLIYVMLGLTKQRTKKLVSKSSKVTANKAEKTVRFDDKLHQVKSCENSLSGFLLLPLFDMTRSCRQTL